MSAGAGPSAIAIPRLHVVTDDGVLSAPDFTARAVAVLEAHGPAVAVHLRGHGVPGGELYRVARSLVDIARDTGTLLLVNDRVDVALAVQCGAQVGRRSVPVASARAALGPAVPLGYSAHEVGDALAATASGADFVLTGTIWPSASHPGRIPAGTGLLEVVAAAVRVPVLAIGGVTTARVEEAVAAGAHGVAVLGGVWSSGDPVAAAAGYLESLGGRDER